MSKLLRNAFFVWGSKQNIDFTKIYDIEYIESIRNEFNIQNDYKLNNNKTIDLLESFVLAKTPIYLFDIDKYVNNSDAKKLGRPKRKLSPTKSDSSSISSFETIPQKTREYSFCAVCNKTMTSPSLINHYKTKLHKKRLQNMQIDL